MAFGTWPPVTENGSLTLIGFATIESNATISRFGGVLLSVAHPSTGNYKLSVILAASGEEEEDPNVAIMVQPDATVLVGAEWEGIGLAGAWDVSLVNVGGSDLDSRFSAAFFKGTGS